MIRVMRYASKRIPRFLTHDALIAGRMVTTNAKRIAVSHVWLDGDLVAMGSQLSASGLALVESGSFDWSIVRKERPKHQKRAHWDALVDTFERSSLDVERALDAVWHQVTGPWSKEVSLAPLDLYATAVSCAWMEPSSTWCTIHVSGLEEEMLVFMGDHHAFNRHATGWMIPFVGRTRSRDVPGSASYCFTVEQPVEVHTWLQDPGEWLPAGPEDHVHPLS